MKRKQTIIILVASLITITSFAKGTSFGITSGANISRMAFSPASAYGTNKILSKPGIAAGLLLNVPLSNAVSIETGLLYSRKGVRFTASYLGSSLEVQYKYNYVELPLYCRYTFKGIFFAVGPYVGVISDAQVKVISTDTSYTEKLSIGSDPKTDNITRTDVGINLKAGYQLPIGLFFSAQYGLGFVNILPPPGVTGKNRVITISVGYYFGKSVKKTVNKMGEITD